MIYGRKHDLMTRAEAIAMTSTEIVDRLDNENCDFTNRVMPDGSDEVEFSASVFLPDENPYRLLTAYYYQTEREEWPEDMSDLDWEIAGYQLD